MGVDYTGIGGVGIKITEEMQGIIESQYEMDDEMYFSELLDELDIDNAEGGSGAYGGRSSYYFLVSGSKLSEIQNNYSEFIDKLSDLGIEITYEDLEVISDILMW